MNNTSHSANRWLWQYCPSPYAWRFACFGSQWVKYYCMDSWQWKECDPQNNLWNVRNFFNLFNKRSCELVQAGTGDEQTCPISCPTFFFFICFKSALSVMYEYADHLNVTVHWDDPTIVVSFKWRKLTLEWKIGANILQNDISASR